MGAIIGFSGESYDAVRVVRIRERDEEDTSTAPDFNILRISDREAYDVTLQLTIQPAEANLLLGLWEALPDDGPMRCHTPRHGFQLISEGAIVFSAAVCFQCNNIAMAGLLASSNWRTFGADSRQGQAFLAEFERLLGRGVDLRPNSDQ